LALTVPKIGYYPPAGGGYTTFTFTYPPRRQPFKAYETTRHDNISSAGVRETIVERTDEFLYLEMEYVVAGSDVTAWQTFIQAALLGTSFDYYPDSTLGTYSTYVLEGTTWRADYKSLGMYTFSIKARLRIAWP